MIKLIKVHAGAYRYGPFLLERYYDDWKVWSPVEGKINPQRVSMHALRSHAIDWCDQRLLDATQARVANVINDESAPT